MAVPGGAAADATIASAATNERRSSDVQVFCEGRHYLQVELKLPPRPAYSSSDMG